MLSIKSLTAKRRRKEIKRKAKRRKLFLASILANVGRKAKELREQALKVIMNNPKLKEQYLANKTKKITD